MADERGLHRSVTKFMIDTCPIAEANHDAPVIFLHRCALKSVYGADDVDLFATGSSAEFYICPVLPFVGDLDTMYSFNNSVAIQAGAAPPSELPDHFHRVVRVHEMVDSNLPGYVYIRPSCLLRRQNGRYVPDNECNLGLDRCCSFLPRSILSSFNSGTYSFDDGPQYKRSKATVAKHGPATQSVAFFPPKLHQQLINTSLPRTDIFGKVDNDFVECIRCASWPYQAAEWPMRHREHGWPDSATISFVVSNGCDVVQAVHPLCKHDEWMSEHQWRLSFSRAEVTLLNSWTQLQQIIYHMLRVVIKKEIVLHDQTKYPDAPTLSGYHIKTLMLWACEQKPQCWWSAESSVIKLCSFLISKLYQWVFESYGQHYFLSDCNILNHLDDRRLVLCSQLQMIAEEPVLLHWFVDHYVLKCIQLCPNEVQILFGNTVKRQGLDKAIDDVVELKSKALQFSVKFIFFAVNEIMLLYILHMEKSCSFVSCIKLQAVLKELKELGELLCEFVVATACLHIAYNMSIHSVSDYLLEQFCILFEPCASGIGDSVAVIVDPVIPGAIVKAIHLAKTSTSCRNSLDKLYIEMAKAFLHNSLKCVYICKELTSTDCMAHILLALLCCKTGHYRTAITHCKQVLCRLDRVHCALRHIEIEYLVGIDMTVDSMLGLIILYEHVLGKALTHAQPQYDDRVNFTMELLINHLISRCSILAEKRGEFTESGACQWMKYKQCLSHTQQLFMSDILLCKIVESQLSNRKEIKMTASGEDNWMLTDVDTSSLVFSLEQVALEKLVAYRQVIIRDMPMATNEFEELFLYKCGLYEECETLCQDNLMLILRAVDRPENRARYWLSYPELLSLLDGELVSLYGIIRLLHPNFFTLLQQLPTLLVTIVRPMLSLYLLVECQKKLRSGSSSFYETLRLIITMSRIYGCNSNYFDGLTLRLIYRTLRIFIEKHKLM